GAATGATADARAFLLGDELCVVPVADPAATTITARLPLGRWRRLRLCDPVGATRGAEELHDGGGDVQLDAPLGQPVILQRAGSVVVLDDGARLGVLDTGHVAAAWSLHVVLDATGRASGRGYDDAGDGHGPSRLDSYEATSDADAVRLQWSARGEYPREGPVEVRLKGLAAQAATCDGRAVEVRADRGGCVVTVDGGFELVELRGLEAPPP
ncbi:MAG TPA: hypothetical protein VMD28_10710, partial [Acidimicrobiales bacterium]|nr:hypothetical protein [Acidimicrobiales bacterium]